MERSYLIALLDSLPARYPFEFLRECRANGRLESLSDWWLQGQLFDAIVKNMPVDSGLPIDDLPDEAIRFVWEVEPGHYPGVLRRGNKYPVLYHDRVFQVVDGLEKPRIVREYYDDARALHQGRGWDY